MMKFRNVIIFSIFLLFGTTAQAAATLEECNEALAKFKQLGDVPKKTHR
jgi:hypothetical protein